MRITEKQQKDVVDVCRVIFDTGSAGGKLCTDDLVSLEGIIFMLDQAAAKPEPATSVSPNKNFVKYIADYIRHEIDDCGGVFVMHLNSVVGKIDTWIEQGMEAFTSINETVASKPVTRVCPPMPECKDPKIDECSSPEPVCKIKTLDELIHSTDYDTHKAETLLNTQWYILNGAGIDEIDHMESLQAKGMFGVTHDQVMENWDDYLQTLDLDGETSDNISREIDVKKLYHHKHGTLDEFI